MTIFFRTELNRDQKSNLKLFSFEMTSPMEAAIADLRIASESFERPA